MYSRKLQQVYKLNRKEAAAYTYYVWGSGVRAPGRRPPAGGGVRHRGSLCVALLCPAFCLSLKLSDKGCSLSKNVFIGPPLIPQACLWGVRVGRCPLGAGSHPKASRDPSFQQVMCPERTCPITLWLSPRDGGEVQSGGWGALGHIWKVGLSGAAGLRKDESLEFRGEKEERSWWSKGNQGTGAAGAPRAGHPWEGPAREEKGPETQLAQPRHSLSTSSCAFQTWSGEGQMGTQVPLLLQILP